MKYEVNAGTRNDPHAQARQARQLPLLLHSMSVFREIFEIIFANRNITTVVEVGVESGKVSGMYVELGAGAVYCVDPKPTDELRANLAQNKALHLVEGWSPDALADLPRADLYVLDGDHNYAIVHDELSWVMANAPDAVVVLHDVLWPCARRDLYYEPSSVPPERKHPESNDGPTVWHDELTPMGFVGLGAFTSACHAGGQANGVLTGVEDALANAPADDAWDFELVPAVFGMGVAVRRAAPSAGPLMESLRPYSASRLLATMENNRIALYSRVLQMQYEAVAHADDADRLADAISGQRQEIDRLTADHRASAARHAVEVESLRLENDRLRHLLNRRLRPRIAGALRRVGKATVPTIRKVWRK
jgi:hypothetical protein